MNPSTNPFSILAAQVRRGDALARLRLREQMEHQMIHAVRIALRFGASRTSLDRRIQEEASYVRRRTPPDASLDPEQLVHEIARRLCECVLANLRTGTEESAANDTIALSTP